LKKKKFRQYDLDNMSDPGSSISQNENSEIDDAT